MVDPAFSTEEANAMKAAVLYGNEDIRYEDWPEPSIEPGCIKVRVRATGICGSDIPRVFRSGAHFYPIVLGHEFSGDVVEVGEGVSTIQVGDTVSGVPLIPCHKCGDCQQGNFSLCKHYDFIGSRRQGSFADYVVIPAENAVKYSSSIPYEQAAMFEPATVALHGVLLNDYSGGWDTAILGCGTIGIFTAQWAKIFGSRRLAVFDVNDGRLELAKRLGADAAFNTAAPDFMEQVQEYTNGQGFGRIFETAGHPATLHLAFQLAANKAHVCCIGTPSQPVTFSPQDWELLNRKEFHLTGSWMSYSAPFPGREWDLCAQFLASGQLKFDPSFIHKRYPMSQAAEAFAEYRHPEQVHGKIMLFND